jgi:hypothetical protein
VVTDSLGNGRVGNVTKVPVLDILIVGIDTFPPGAEVVRFQLENMLPLAPEPVVRNPVGSGRPGMGAEVSVRGTLIVGADALPPEGNEVLFQVGAKLPPEDVSEDD